MVVWLAPASGTEGLWDVRNDRKFEMISIANIIGVSVQTTG